MDFFEVVEKRRSIRKFSRDDVPDAVIEKALHAAIWAPNSSNLQTWDFFWVANSEKKANLVKACLNQAAARTAQHLIVVTANAKLWKRSQAELIAWTKRENAPKVVEEYYSKLIPLTYSTGFGVLSAVKKFLGSVAGLFTPFMRRPATLKDLYEVSIKSSALACENFALAITAQGFDTCMMEGFDEVRVMDLLDLSNDYRVVMVIAVGKTSERGTWGKPFRLPHETVIHKI